MEALEFKILTKRRELQDLLSYALNQSPVYLPVIKSLKVEIKLCDAALVKLSLKRRLQLG